MTGNRSKLKNFVEKFIETVRFGKQSERMSKRSDFVLKPGSLFGRGLLYIHAFWEGGGMGVQVNFLSQITTTALSIENGSVFEGESEFKIYFITQVYKRSDWEDLPWLFRNVVCYESRFGAFPRGGLLYPPHGGLSNCLAAVWAYFLEICPNLIPFQSIANTMADQNVPAQAPTRTDERILPYSQWLQIGKSNLLFDVQKIQKNPIFRISVDILRNTNFFRAFFASTSVPAIYIQQFWNTMKYDEKTGALDIIPIDPAHPFELPSTGDMVIDFVNQLGYPKPVEFVSNIRVNYVYQPWRAILTLINQCLTGKTSGSDKPRHPVLQMLWGIVTQTNVDHAELLWEEFTQGIQTFFSHKASHKGSLKDPKKKAVPLFIPYGQFTKMIIYYLGSTSDVHRRPESPRHLPGDDFLLGNLKFIPKGETYEVFGMAIPKQLITEAIQQSSYYPKYLEMRTPPKKPTTTTSVKPTKPPSSKQPKSPKKKPSKVTPSRKVQKESLLSNLLMKKMNLKEKLSLYPFFLPQGQAPVRGVSIHEHIAEEIPKLPKVVGKGVIKQVMIRQPQDDTSEKVVHESSSITDSECTEKRTKATAPKVDKEQGEVASISVKSRVGIFVHTEDQAESDPGKAHEALARPDVEPMQENQTGSDSGKEHVTLAGPNPEHMDGDFYATSYPKVHENLKLRTDEHVIEENPESHSRSMSSMKNLEDTNTFGDQFLNDKPTEDDHEKSNVVDKTDSIILDLSDQTDTSVPPVTTLVICIPSPKPSSQVTTPPINTEATAITTTLPEITPFIALQLRVAKLEQDMSEVKKTDHSAAVLAFIQSQVPKVVDKYLGTKVDNALLKALEKHTADLIQKYSVMPGPESSKKQESEKSPKKIIRIKREQGEKEQESTYTIKSTDKAALEEYDLKSALFTHMHKILIQAHLKEF
ncbi:hypothetical protein Tco_0863908 [Tanacetum coccineum]